MAGLVIAEGVVKPDHGLKEPDISDYTDGGVFFVYNYKTAREAYEAADSRTISISPKDMEIKEGDLIYADYVIADFDKHVKEEGVVLGEMRDHWEIRLGRFIGYVKKEYSTKFPIGQRVSGDEIEGVLCNVTIIK